MRYLVRPYRLFVLPILLGFMLGFVTTSFAQTATPTAATAKPKKKPDFPDFKTVTEGYTKVTSTMDGKPGLFTIWKREKDGQMLAELPRTYSSDKYFIALTVNAGEQYAGLQSGDRYVTWRRYDKRLALVEPNITVRSTGEQESKDSVKRLFTDRIMLDVPIVCLSPSKTPVIDMDALLVGQASRFFPISARGANPRLSKIKTAKSFPGNVELSFEVAMLGGKLKTLHYSISKITNAPSYKPRKADERIGYFTTSFTDLGKYKRDDTTVRYINRWHLEKADPKLKLSPPKQPIVFYIEHTTPKRYRHWVKKGILLWNKAFEDVGIRDAIVVYQQDSNKNIFPNHMEKDPEDVRYNFVRWLNNNVGTAIGPSRVNPMTGQILDADIILTDGWIRYYDMQYNEILPKVAMEGFGPETLAWLNQHPKWDPRILLAHPSERQRLLIERRQLAMQPRGGHAMANLKTNALGDDEFDGLVNRQSQMNGLCLAAEGKGFDLNIMQSTLEILAAMDDDEDEDDEDSEEDDEDDEDEEGDDEDEDEEDKDKKALAAKSKKKSSDEDDDDEKKDEDKDDKDEDEDEKDTDDVDDDDEKAAKKKEDEGQKLDGIPEEFIGPLLMELVAHEVGHTLGLRHNFKASSIYTLDEIAAGETGGGPLSGSVMDYLPINMRMKDGEIQGEHTMTDIGPYDRWAIEYGYTSAKKLDKILARVAEPELVYGTDEDTYGPDPRARRYDFTKKPLDYAKDQMKLADFHRENLLDKFVKDGDSWSKARRGYEMSLSLQTRSLSMMSNWIGGTFVNRDKKGDKNARDPLSVVDVDEQREALDWILENAFEDEAFGLSPELIRHLSTDQWLDNRYSDDVDFPVHDRVMGIQSSTLTMLMNPMTLRLVYDNEARTPGDEDALTLPELLGTVSDAIWSELEESPTKSSVREPWLSSTRRNLQREHLQRLIDLTLPSAGFTAAYKPIPTLAVHRLKKINAKIKKALKTPSKLDDYSLAHLEDANTRIEKALDADYIYNVNDLGGGGGGGFMLFLQPENAKDKE